MVTFENKKNKKGSIFAKAVSYDEMYDLFTAVLMNPLRTESNVQIALFKVDSLSTHNLLHYSYQELIPWISTYSIIKGWRLLWRECHHANISIAKKGKYIGNPYDSFVKELTNAVKMTSNILSETTKIIILLIIEKGVIKSLIPVW